MIPHSAHSRCVKAVQGQFPLMVSLICIILAGFVYFLPDAFPAQVTLSWDSPTTNTDGTPLTDLSGYNVYYGTTSRSYSQTIDAGNTNSYTVSNLSDGTYYFAVTAYDVSRNESTYSNEVNKTIQSTPTYALTVNRTGNGTVTGQGINCGADCTEPYDQGTVITLSASPNSGSSFTGWSGGGCSGTGQCVITMNATTTVTATFSSLNTYAITASAGSGGNISPSGAVSVNQGASQTFTITPNAGYSIADVKVDNTSVGKVTSYTFSNVTAAHTIQASFAPVTYAITASAGSGGSISPSGAVSVNHGASQTFTITPNTGYRIAGVTVDGASVGAVTSYTFSNVTAPHTIQASFSSTLTYTIIASAGTGGSISPTGSVKVNKGASKTFTITPKLRYRIADVTVDGVSVGVVTSYTFSNVSANHTIRASFLRR